MKTFYSESDFQQTFANRNSKLDIPPHNNVAFWNDGIVKESAPQPNVIIPITSPPLKLLLMRFVKPVITLGLLESNTAIKLFLRNLIALAKSISPDKFDIEPKNPKLGSAFVI